ncbi:NAD(P)/FAD-dependent oxidoreductase [Roseovarius sp. S1116L3]|uniref:NAD(P)/FAD-dependent oxidoreductase n=1 Tax=Roseovarius roseus TaxID=3342636 RepID=UPI00372B24F5
MSKLPFPTYSNICGWNAMLPIRRPHTPVAGDQTFDYAVIGAGFTGLAIARRLHELDPQARIAVLEATTVGEGSSARNSGFTAAEVLPRTATMKGAETARRQSALIGPAFHWLTGLIEEKGIDCNMRKVGSIRAAATEAGEVSLRNVIEVAQFNGIKHTVLGQAEIADRIGSDYYRLGIYVNDTYLIQPAALIRGLADTLPENVSLYENSPVLGMTRENSGWALTTNGGMIRASQVALANNSFIRSFGYLKLRMATIYTYAAITAPVPEADLGQLGSAENWGLLPAHRLGTTLRRIGRDRLMVRSLYAYESEVSQDEAISKLRSRFINRWPDLAHVNLEYVWGGTTAFTMNGAPWWGRLEPGLFASGGCNGSGIAKGTMLGRHLAELMTGAGTPEAVTKAMGTASLIAPEPFRSIGFQIISALESRKAGRET